MTQESKSKHIFFVAAGAAIISFSAVFVRLSAVHPDAAAFYRVLFGTLAILPVLVLRREKLHVDRLTLKWGLIAAVFFFLDLAAWHRSIHYLGPGLATLFGNLQVFFVACAGFFLLKEKISLRFIISVPLALTGILCVLNPAAFSVRSDFGAGVILGMVTSICYTGYLLSLHRLKLKQRGRSAAAIMCLVSALCAMIFFSECVIAGVPLSIPSGADWVYMILYGVTCQGIAWILITRSMPRIGASLTGLLLLIQPVFSYAWDILIFNRRPMPLEFAGVIIALCAIYLGSGAGRSRR
jgi:drug/metabolite transporter (DMT)-like permease